MLGVKLHIIHSKILIPDQNLEIELTNIHCATNSTYILEIVMKRAALIFI